jgi:hypothetical protein
MRTGTSNPRSDSRMALAHWGRPVEGGQETIAQGLYSLSAEPRKLAVHRLVMRFEKVAPRSVALRFGALGRIDDVLEHHGREHAVDHGSRSRASKKLFQFSGDRIAGGGVEKEEMIGPWKLKQSGSGNSRGQFAAAFHAHQRVLRPMDNQRWDSYRMQNSGEVDFAIHSHQRDGG